MQKLKYKSKRKNYVFVEYVIYEKKKNQILIYIIFDGYIWIKNIVVNFYCYFIFFVVLLVFVKEILILI